MELELGLGLPRGGTGTMEMETISSEMRDDECSKNKKRRYEEAFERTTLPLFDGCDDEISDGEVADSCNDDFKQELYHSRTSKELVGWPPVKCSWTRDSSDAEQGTYVKVTMEGMLIGRKLDLSLHNSYQDLFKTFERMFPAYRHPDDKRSSNHHHHMVTYEDGDGDWMLIGDLPWEVFVKSVKRIKIVGLYKQEETARNY